MKISRNPSVRITTKTAIVDLCGFYGKHRYRRAFKQYIQAVKIKRWNRRRK